MVYFNKLRKWHRRYSTVLIFFAVIVVALIAIGCAGGGTGPRFSPSSIEPGDARVYHYREKAGAGSALAYYVFRDGKLVGRVGNGGYFTETLKPGTHVYKKRREIKMGPIAFLVCELDNALAKEEPAIEFKAEPGNEYFIKWSIVWGGIETEIVDKTVAAKEISDLKEFPPVEENIK